MVNGETGNGASSFPIGRLLFRTDQIGRMKYFDQSRHSRFSDALLLDWGTFGLTSEAKKSTIVLKVKGAPLFFSEVGSTIAHLRGFLPHPKTDFSFGKTWSGTLVNDRMPLYR